jgi:histone deacetylase 11
MIIDLDAHQGNGHEKDFANDGMDFLLMTFLCTMSCLLYVCIISYLLLAERVYILDMYNAGIYPFVRTYILNSP